MTTPTALPNLRVLEVASLIPGPYCGKLLASLGAEVIKAEPPGVGDPPAVAARSRMMSPIRNAAACSCT